MSAARLVASAARLGAEAPRMGARHTGVQGNVPEITGSKLELVVPFTTPALTRAALRAAEILGMGLNAGVRLLKVQVTPWPLEPDRSPVPITFLEEQLRRMRSDLPMEYEVRLARDFTFGVESALRASSVVLLAAAKRPWLTRNERLADSLRRAGHAVILIPESRGESQCST